MNKKGQLQFYGIMLSVVLFIAIVTMIDPIKDVVTDARTTLDCDNTSLDTGLRMACIQIGFYLPGYLGLALGVAIAVIGIRRLLRDNLAE